ncbi:MAG: hypothetical protein M1827_004421 [Pycnora praestabilis]|nr:MAG: hypothetical protein M1827_004421 [Pycnora praestabilis]
MVQANAYGSIFSATYSNVPVYEYNVNGNHVMRRRFDDWINATHILKVADFDKPARTRILEREVQKGVHEKVQGGYGKYQGTWVPLHDGRDLAQRNGVLELLRPIFDYVPGDRSPPQAPKHTTAASNKTKTAKPAVAPRRPPMPAPSQINEDLYDNISAQLNDDDTPDNSTIASGSMIEDDDTFQSSQQSTGHRKRKRGADYAEAMSMIEQQHQLYADELLDYFMLSAPVDGRIMTIRPPEPPMRFEVDRQIDDQGHTALHWAAAMGDIEVVKDLIDRRANMASTSSNGETPLMRAVLFTNNHEKNTMPKLINMLQGTVHCQDYYKSTVFHHIAATTSSKGKLVCARYYLETIINKLSERMSGVDLATMLNAQDQVGDTALIIAARNGARKCVRSLVGHNAAGDIANNEGETADGIILELSNHQRARYSQASSSPFQLDPNHPGREIAQIGLGTSLDSIDPRLHHSEAAMTVTQKFAPLIMEKSLKLASAFDNELEEKEIDYAEAQRLLKNMDQDIQVIRKKTVAHITHEEDDVLDLSEDCATLIRDNENLLEQSQHSELHHLVRAEESKTSPIMYHQQNISQEDQIREKLQLATSLHHEQLQRRALVRDVVRKSAVAGMGENHNIYRRLISRALNVKEEDVENVLPEIVKELEDALQSDTMQTTQD